MRGVVFDLHLPYRFQIGKCVRRAGVFLGSRGGGVVIVGDVVVEEESR